MRHITYSSLLLTLAVGSSTVEAGKQYGPCPGGGVCELGGTSPVGGPFRIYSPWHQKFVDIPLNNIQAGTEVALWHKKSGSNQQFTFDHWGDGWYFIRSVADPNLCIDIKNGQLVAKAGPNYFDPIDFCYFSRKNDTDYFEKYLLVTLLT